MKKQEIIALGVVIAVGMAQTAFAESDGAADSKPDSGNRHHECEFNRRCDFKRERNNLQ